MYNRYIPQSDGSFQRSPVQDTSQNRPRGNGAQMQRQNAPPQAPPQQVPLPPQSSPAPPVHGEGTVQSFLSGLLPQSFDTEDMIIILLLLLLGNAGKDNNNAFLTLIIYLFL